MANKDYEQGYRSRNKERDFEGDDFERSERSEREHRDEWYGSRTHGGSRIGGEPSSYERGYISSPYGREPYGGCEWSEGRRGTERSDIYDRQMPGRRFSSRDYSERDDRYDAGDFGTHGSWDYAAFSGPYPSGSAREYRDREYLGFGGAAPGYGPPIGYGYGTAGRYIGGPQEVWPREQQGRRGSFSGRGPRGFRRSDERIREDVNERLTRHPDIDASDIEVRVDSCEVVLIGVVEDRKAKRLAEDIAEDVWGVDDVRNELKVRRGFLAALTGEKADERDVTQPAVRDAANESTRMSGRSTSTPSGATTQPTATTSTNRP